MRNFFESYKEPSVSSAHWKPVVQDYMTDVSAAFNYVELIHENPGLYSRIKHIEGKLDMIKAVPLSVLLPIVNEWRGLILEAEFEQRQGKSR